MRGLRFMFRRAFSIEGAGDRAVHRDFTAITTTKAAFLQYHHCAESGYLFRWRWSHYGDNIHALIQSLIPNRAYGASPILMSGASSAFSWYHSKFRRYHAYAICRLRELSGAHYRCLHRKASHTASRIFTIHDLPSMMIKRCWWANTS